jgi:peptidoglycan hydrolase CwlO-like protein
MPIDKETATVELALAHRAIQESKSAVQYGKRDVSRLQAEIQDLRHQMNISRKAIIETRAFIEHLDASPHHSDIEKIGARSRVIFKAPE